MRFLVDAQLPASLADALRRAGAEAEHVADLGLATGTDRQIWDAAVTRAAVLVTKDKDFAVMRGARNDGPTILWVRMGNIDNRTLTGRILRALPRLRSAIERGDAVIEFIGR